MKRWLVAAAMVLATGSASSGELRYDVGTNDNPVYEKECGGCHFPYCAGT